MIKELYERFFRKAFKKQSEALGIVYTPVEIVDFILRAADDVSRKHFGKGLTDEGVTILDPFAAHQRSLSACSSRLDQARRPRAKIRQ
nr:restriction-modification system LlaBIII [Streptococcus thermophilus]